MTAVVKHRRRCDTNRSGLSSNKKGLIWSQHNVNWWETDQINPSVQGAWFHYLLGSRLQQLKRSDAEEPQRETSCSANAQLQVALCRWLTTAPVTLGFQTEKWHEATQSSPLSFHRIIHASLQAGWMRAIRNRNKVWLMESWAQPQNVGMETSVPAVEDNVQLEKKKKRQWEEPASHTGWKLQLEFHKLDEHD